MTDFDPLDYWPASAFRGVNHCPTCLLRQDTSECTCKDLEQAPEVVEAVAPPEEPPTSPELSPAVEHMDQWAERRDLE